MSNPGVLPWQTAIRTSQSGVPSAVDPGTGLIPDGSARLQALATQAGNTLELRIDAPCRVVTPILIPDGAEVTITQPMDATGIPSGRAAIEAFGSQDVLGAVPLAANVNPGDTQFQVTPGFESRFSVGQVVKLQANTYFAGSAASTSGVDAYIGELVTVKSIAPGVVTLDGQVNLTYLAAAPDSGSALGLTYLRGIKIKTRGAGVITCNGSGSNQRGITLDRVRDSEVIARVDKAEDTGIRHVECIDINTKLVGDGGGAHTNTTFYGASYQGCTDCTYAGAVVRRYKHAVTCSGSTSRPGVNFRISYVNCTSVGTLSTGFDSHAMVIDLIMDACNIYYPGNQADDAGDVGGGISCRCPSATITGNRIFGAASYGGWLRNQSTLPTRWIWAQNYVYNTQAEGLLIDLHPPVTAGRTIDSINIEGGNLSNCGLGAAATDALHIYSGNADRLSSISLSGVDVHGCTGYCVHIEQTDNPSINGGELIAGATGLGTIKLENCTNPNINGATLLSPTIGAGKGIFLTGPGPGQSVSGGQITGNTLSGFATGIQADSNTSGIRLSPNSYTNCTTRLSNSGTGNVVSSENYRILHHRQGEIDSGGSAGQRTIAFDENLGGPGTATGGRGAFYFDPADYQDPSGEKTLKLNIDGQVISNATDPANTYTIAMWSVVSSGGAASATVSVVLGAGVAGSTVPGITPGPSALVHNTSGDFTPPAAGWYTLTVSSSAATPALATVLIRATLRFRLV